MNDEDRVARWLEDLRATLDKSDDLVARGEEAFHTDPALPLAFEALSNRVGELAKRLAAADPERFSGFHLRQAARNRDFVVHHYNRIDVAMLWRTVVVSFPRLRDEIDR